MNRLLAQEFHYGYYNSFQKHKLNHMKDKQHICGSCLNGGRKLFKVYKCFEEKN